MNAVAHLVSAARTCGDRIAVRCGDRTLSHRAVDMLGARFAGILHSHGVTPGQPVAVMMPNVAEFAPVHSAILRSGAVAVILPPTLEPPDVAAHVRDSGARLVVAWHALAEVVEQAGASVDIRAIFVVPDEFAHLLHGAHPIEDPVQRDGVAVAVVVYGTNGDGPVVISHDALHSDARAAAAACGMARDEATVGALRLDRALALTVSLHGVLGSGGSLTLPDRDGIDAAVAAVLRDGAVALHADAQLLEQLPAHPQREKLQAGSLRVVVCAGELSADAAAELRGATGATVLCGCRADRLEPGGMVSADCPALPT